MGNEQIKKLEYLMGELQAELSGPINITYPVIQDGYGLAVYDFASGNLMASTTSYNLKTAIEQLKKNF